MFERFISIDWSGAEKESKRSGLRIVQATLEHNGGAVVNSPKRDTCWWKRAECIDWLVQVLQEDEPRCLVALDFGFSYPWGSDESVFTCTGWKEMLRVLSRLYAENGSARSMAEKVNLSPRFGGHGPYRFDYNRTDFRFYLDSETPYYRLVEMAIPQAISQWYLGSGGTVGFSSITGMAAIHYLMGLRERGEINFQVWPQECNLPDADKHVIVESYPAVCPEPQDYGECKDQHCRDAWKVLQWMLTEAKAETLDSRFEITPKPFGRGKDVSFEDQISFEGWIFGVS